MYEDLAPEMSGIPPVGPVDDEKQEEEEEVVVVAQKRQKLNPNLRVDVEIEISSQQMRAQLKITADIIHETRPRASALKRLPRWRAEGRNSGTKAAKRRATLKAMQRRADGGLASELVAIHEEMLGAVKPLEQLREEDAADDQLLGPDLGDVDMPELAGPDLGDVEMPELGLEAPALTQEEIAASGLNNVADDLRASQLEAERHRFDLNEERVDSDFFGNDRNPMRVSKTGWSRRTRKMWSFLDKTGGDVLSFEDDILMGQKPTRLTVEASSMSCWSLRGTVSSTWPSRRTTATSPSLRPRACTRRYPTRWAVRKLGWRREEEEVSR
eukprot:224814_1